MTRSATVAVTPDDVARYRRDGVVCIRRALDSGWVERMRLAADRIKAKPGPLRQRLRPQDPGEFISDKFMWTFDPDFRAFVFETRLAEIVGRLMESRRVNLFHDQLIVKEPRTPAPSPWHQDLNYFPFFGRQCCSAWLPLDKADRASGTLEFVRGSQAWHDRPFSRDNVFANTENAPQASAAADAVDGELAEVQPDIEARRGDFEIVSWDMEPGDVVVFSAFMLHAAPGNSTVRRRRAVSTRWAGDDVRFAKKRVSMELIRDPGLKPGDALDCELFPVVWRLGA